jgi:crotonobetainyl-CoA:carnitine CoA-transferase CaiB-like acyl-CoA transferase
MSDRKLKLRQCKQSGATAGPHCTHRDAWWSKRIVWIVRTTASSVAAMGRHGQDIMHTVLSPADRNRNAVLSPRVLPIPFLATGSLS